VATRITGGPELRARLTNVVRNADFMEAVWAKDAAARIKADAPTDRGRGKASIRAGASRGRGAVFGAFWLVFVDRGTKAHEIIARKASVLRFEYRGRVIFAKKVQRRAMRRRPFITRGAQEALAGLPIRDAIIQAWNRRRAGRFTKI
jgi:hypothetical protein